MAAAGGEQSRGAASPLSQCRPLRPATFTLVPGRAARRDTGGGQRVAGWESGSPCPRRCESGGGLCPRRGAGLAVGGSCHPALAQAEPGPSAPPWGAPAAPLPPPVVRLFFPPLSPPLRPSAVGWAGPARRRPRPRPAEVTPGGGRRFRRAGSGGPAGGARSAAPCLPRPAALLCARSLRSPASTGLSSRKPAVSRLCGTSAGFSPTRVTKETDFEDTELR